MISKYIEDAIRQFGAVHITEVFLYTLLTVFVMSLWWKRNDQHAVFTNYTPTLLTSLGILGTFTGIISGLLEFNTDDIDGSIGLLLSGLKTAFLTSLAGMFLSIVFKALISSGVMKKVDAEVISEDEIGTADIYRVMKQQADGIELLRKAISENDESSLVGQTKLLRSDMSDNHKANHQHMLLMAKAVTGLHDLSEKQQENFIEFEDRLWIGARFGPRHRYRLVGLDDFGQGAHDHLSRPDF